MTLFASSDDEEKQLRDSIVRRALEGMDRAILALQADDEDDALEDVYAQQREDAREVADIETRMRDERWQAIVEISEANRKKGGK